MIVTVQFKNKDKVDEKNYNYICNGTRVKVVALRKEKFSDSLLTEIKYVTSTLD